MALEPDALLSSSSVLTRSIEAMQYVHLRRESRRRRGRTFYALADLGHIISLH